MRSHAFYYAITMAIIAFCSGCGDRPDTVAASQPVEAPVVRTADTSAVLTTPSTGARVWFDPAALEDCAAPQVGTIHWDASRSSAESIDLKIGRDDGGENLFTSSGSIGSAITGPWLRPGLVVIVRDKATGAELGRNVVAAEPCSS